MDGPPPFLRIHDTPSGGAYEPAVVPSSPLVVALVAGRGAAMAYLRSIDEDDLLDAARWRIGGSPLARRAPSRLIHLGWIIEALNESAGDHNLAVVEDQGLLHRAARAGDLRALDWLLQRGHSANPRDRTCARNGSALCQAVQRLDIASVDLLLRRGAWPDVSLFADDFGNPQQGGAQLWALPDFPTEGRAVRADAPPLAIAAKFGAVRIAELLLQRGAAVEGFGTGDVPLHDAIAYRRGDDVVPLLLRWGANTRNMLDFAARVASPRVCHALVDAGAVDDGEFLDSLYRMRGTTFDDRGGAHEYAVVEALLRVARTPGFLNGLLSGPLLHRGGDARAAGLAFLAKQAGATVPRMSPAAWGLFAQDPRVRFASSWVARVLVRVTSTRWTRSERETASRLIFWWLP